MKIDIGNDHVDLYTSFIKALYISYDPEGVKNELDTIHPSFLDPRPEHYNCLHLRNIPSYSFKFADPVVDVNLPPQFSIKPSMWYHTTIYFVMCIAVLFISIVWMWKYPPSSAMLNFNLGSIFVILSLHLWFKKKLFDEYTLVAKKILSSHFRMKRWFHHELPSNEYTYHVLTVERMLKYFNSIVTEEKDR